MQEVKKSKAATTTTPTQSRKLASTPQPRKPGDFKASKAATVSRKKQSDELSAMEQPTSKDLSDSDDNEDILSPATVPAPVSKSAAKKIPTPRRRFGVSMPKPKSKKVPANNDLFPKNGEGIHCDDENDNDSPAFTSEARAQSQSHSKSEGGRSR